MEDPYSRIELQCLSANILPVRIDESTQPVGSDGPLSTINTFRSTLDVENQFSGNFILQLTLR